LGQAKARGDVSLRRRFHPVEAIGLHIEAGRRQTSSIEKLLADSGGI